MRLLLIVLLIVLFIISIVLMVLAAHRYYLMLEIERLEYEREMRKNGYYIDVD